MHLLEKNIFWSIMLITFRFMFDIYTCQDLFQNFRPHTSNRIHNIFLSIWQLRYSDFPGSELLGRPRTSTRKILRTVGTFVNLGMSHLPRTFSTMFDFHLILPPDLCYQNPSFRSGNIGYSHRIPLIKENRNLTCNFPTNLRMLIICNLCYLLISLPIVRSNLSASVGTSSEPTISSNSVSLKTLTVYDTCDFEIADRRVW